MTNLRRCSINQNHVLPNHAWQPIAKFSDCINSHLMPWLTTVTQMRIWPIDLFFNTIFFLRDLIESQRQRNDSLKIKAFENWITSIKCTFWNHYLCDFMNHSISERNRLLFLRLPIKYWFVAGGGGGHSISFSNFIVAIALVEFQQKGKWN